MNFHNITFFYYTFLISIHSMQIDNSLMSQSGKFSALLFSRVVDLYSKKNSSYFTNFQIRRGNDDALTKSLKFLSRKTSCQIQRDWLSTPRFCRQNCKYDDHFKGNSFKWEDRKPSPVQRELPCLLWMHSILQVKSGMQVNSHLDAHTLRMQLFSKATSLPENVCMNLCRSTQMSPVW